MLAFAGGRMWLAVTEWWSGLAPTVQSYRQKLVTA